MSELTCRFIEPAGWHLRLTAMWGDDKSCTTGWGHVGRVTVEEIADPDADPSVEGTIKKYQNDPRWEMSCDKCGEKTSGDVKHSASWKMVYDTPSGRPEPGDMFWRPCWAQRAVDKCFHWDNCEGRHLHVVLPDGCDWDADSRANNCTMKEDRTHRCWVHTGEPPNVHVSKTGHTCSAGAGSIATGTWHGFLRHGKLVG